ncbi:MAG: twin-arginine translocase TatA/TatE family subunit [Azospirillaceae bacterium]|nr:twin-arginine translocase TatA/TatE family subunit [Azospirillaceae bacterium]
MGSFSAWHWIIVLLIVLIIFGAGRLPTVMGDVAKGVKAFRNGMKDETPPATAAQAPIAPAAGSTSADATAQTVRESDPHKIEG